MGQVTKLSGRALPLRGDDIDTDRIIPARFLKSITFEGLQDHLFEDDIAQAPAHPVADARYAGARVMIVQSNFGCGSSREHAAWAIQEFGFQAVVAESFGDIFRTNASKNGLLIVSLPGTDVRELLDAAPAEATIDLETQTVVLPSGRTATFDVDPGIRDRLLNGWDDIALTELRTAEIDRYEADRERPGPNVLAI